MKKWMPWMIVAAILVVLIVSVFTSYNSLVNAEENVNQSYSQIQNQLQRRTDLIPNLVNTVKGYASHEKAVIDDVSKARAQLAGAKTPGDQAAANDRLDSALSRLLVVVEKYPDLKANQQYTQLMDELAGTENRLAVARQDYNSAVATYNKKIKRMPGALIAGLFGFKEKEYFKADESAKKTPKVDFGNSSDQ
ncbi:LemA family protein [Heyndrickxia coagulans]|uniref:LemA family protein n=1 Tax=Heyndrickxia coagulans TaxID=1398 RepID=UPI0028F9C9A7|nr:LemA family protein [Heyndrickxia coagulans]MDT9756289.1 LemA family protein [Heyndrickxia coagulans]